MTGWRRLKTYLRSRDYAAVKALLEAASYFCAILTLCVIAYQLRSDANDRQVTKSLELISRYGSDPIASQRLVLRDFELVNKEGYDAIRSAGGLSPEDSQIWIEGRLAAYDRDKPEQKIEIAIREITHYFDEVAICSGRGICDEATLTDFLQAEAHDFKCTFGAVIENQSRTYNRPTLGRGVEKIAGARKCTAG